MYQWKALTGTAAIVLAAAGPASAELSGMQVWENWLAASEGMGQSVSSGAVEQNGDTLTISDVEIAMETPEVTMTGMLDSVVFTDQSDGSVAIMLPDSYTISFDAAPEDGEQVTADLVVTQTGMTMAASELDDGGIAYDFAAPTFNVSVGELVVDGEAIDFSLDMTATDASGLYEVGAGDMPEVTSEISAASLTVDVDATDPEGSGDTVVFDLEMADISGTSSGTVGMMADIENVAEMLQNGMSSAASLSHGAASYGLNVSGSENFSFNASATGGSFDISLDAGEGLGYAISNTGYEVAVSGDEIPMPEITASADEIGLAIRVPVVATEEPQDFGFGLTLAGLTVSDMIWGMFDPAGSLSREPATLIVALEGTGNWFIDIMDPEAQASMGAGMPGALHSLDIADLRLALVGAELTGGGGFTFDNDDLTTFDGMPAPDGQIDLRLVGANALIDNLVAMGLLPEDQAMGARMMMGMFARPGDGADTLVSTIEVNPDGSILANGQRIK